MTTSKKTEHASSQSSGAATADALTMPIAQFDAAVAKVSAAIAQIDTLLPGLVTLTAEARKAGGRYRDGEAQALLPVLTVAQQYPALTQSLANDDQGNDPSTFEVTLLQDRLQRITALQPLVEALEGKTQELSDTLLYLGELTKPVLLAAYKLEKPQAAHDKKIQSMLAPTIDFYAAIAKASVETRQANAAAKAPATPPKTN